MALYYLYYREGEGKRESFVYVCAYARARACVPERVTDYVTFVFIDEVFGVCVCVCDY